MLEQYEVLLIVVLHYSDDGVCEYLIFKFDDGLFEEGEELKPVGRLLFDPLLFAEGVAVVDSHQLPYQGLFLLSEASDQVLQPLLVVLQLLLRPVPLSLAVDGVGALVVGELFAGGPAEVLDEVVGGGELLGFEDAEQFEDQFFGVGLVDLLLLCDGFVDPVEGFILGEEVLPDELAIVVAGTWDELPLLEEGEAVQIHRVVLGEQTPEHVQHDVFGGGRQVFEIEPEGDVFAVEGL